MKGKALQQAIAVAIVFMLAVWLINTFGRTVDWEHVLSFRIGVLGLIVVLLSLKIGGQFESKIKSTPSWFWAVLGGVAVVYVSIFLFKPWVEKQTTRNYQPRISISNSLSDWDTVFVATEARPARVIPRSKITRVTWGPIGRVSYKVTFPTNKGDSTIIFKKESGHIELPFPLKWLEFRPVGEDSVIIVVRQHDP